MLKTLLLGTLLMLQAPAEESVIPLDDFINLPPVEWLEREEQGLQTLEMEATFYTAFCDTGCIGITRTGYDVSNTIYTPNGRRVIAVDPSVIPLHSIVEVKLEDGATFEAKALDTGGAIQGRIIDVLVEDTSTAFRKGRQQIEVTILDRG